MNYELADVTHIEYDKELIFEQTIKLFIGSALVEKLHCSKMKDPWNTFVKINEAWMKAKEDKHGAKVLSE